MPYASRSSRANASMYVSQLTPSETTSASFAESYGARSLTTFARTVLDSSRFLARAMTPGRRISLSSKYAPNAIPIADGVGSPALSGTALFLGAFPQGKANHAHGEAGTTIWGKPQLHHVAGVARADRALSPAGALELLAVYFSTSTSLQTGGV